MGFKVGDIVIFYPNSSNYTIEYKDLTIGKGYIPLSINSTNSIICIKNDINNIKWFSLNYFITLSEWREIVINKILNKNEI